MKDYILRAEGLSVGYDGKPVLRDLTFTLHPGEILTLIGPNGAGKSTLLRTLARQLSPVAGTVLLGDGPMESWQEDALARKLSILLTDRVRGEWMTCEDVVSSGRYPYTGRLGLLSDGDRAKVAEAMALVGITELREQLFSRLSDGQRQRVMLARAICQEPDVLVMDEPASYLDIRYKLELLRVMRTLAKEKHVAMIVSLHEPELARRVSDRVLSVKNGTADRAGTPEEIFTGAYLETLYDLPPGGYAQLFSPPEQKAREKGYAFVQNRACENFPCHRGVPEEDFNCLFCYCPLYTLGPRCGGEFDYTSSGAKSCRDCAFPHRKENYEKVLSRYPELKELAKRTERKDHV